MKLIPIFLFILIGLNQALWADDSQVKPETPPPVDDDLQIILDTPDMHLQLPRPSLLRDDDDQKNPVTEGNPITKDGGIYDDFGWGVAVMPEEVFDSSGKLTHLRIPLGGASSGELFVMGELNSNECKNDLDEDGNPIHKCEDSMWKKHHFFIDLRYLVTMGFGVQHRPGKSLSPQFMLKLKADALLGFSIFRFIPIAGGADSIELNVKNGDHSEKVLLGGTVAIPISLFFGMKNIHFVVGTSIGSRLNSMASDNAFALSPFVKLALEKYQLSTTVKGMYTFDSDVKERAIGIHLISSDPSKIADFLPENLRIGLYSGFVDFEDFGYFDSEGNPRSVGSPLQENILYIGKKF